MRDVVIITGEWQKRSKIHKLKGFNQFVKK